MSGAAIKSVLHPERGRTGHRAGFTAQVQALIDKSLNV